MPKLRAATLTGIATLVAAGLGFAAARDSHIMKLALPDGSVARIRYTGDAPPKVMVVPATRAAPVSVVDLVDASPFDAVGRLAAEFDMQTEEAMPDATHFRALPALAGGSMEPSPPNNLPAGSVHYQFASTNDGNSSCSRSVEVTSYGSGRPAKIIAATSGDCRPDVGRTGTAPLDTPARPASPRSTATRVGDGVIPPHGSVTI